DAGTVYVPRVTLQKVGQPKLVPSFTTLPPYSGEARPPGGGSLRLFKTTGEASDTSGLASGEYLVNDSGLAVWKLQENFPAQLPIAVGIGPARGDDRPRPRNVGHSFVGVCRRRVFASVCLQPDFHWRAHPLANRPIHSPQAPRLASDGRTTGC